MLPECPHCFARVIPRPDRSCPNCSEQLDQPNGLGLVSVWIRPTTVLPDICHRCGVPTSRREDVVEWTRQEVYVEDQDFASRYILFSVVWLILPFTILLGRFSGVSNVDKQHLISVPTCKPCSSKQTVVLEVKPEFQRSMRIVVAQKFAQLMTDRSQGESIG